MPEQIKYPTEAKADALERVLKLHATREGVEQYSITWILDKLTDDRLKRIINDIEGGAE